MLSRANVTSRATPAIAAAALVAIATGGCYAAHGLPTDGDRDGGPACDPGARLECARRDGACEPLELAPAICDEVTLAWRCPEGAAPYEPPWQDDVCLPLLGSAGALFSDGVHEAPVPIPIGDRCAWVMPVERGVGEPVDLVATHAAARCDLLEPPDDRPIAALDGGADYVAIQASFTDATGTTRVLARGWAWDASAPFGVRGVGVGIGAVEGDTIRIAPAWLFGDDLDLGDAALAGDDGLAYAYGCPGPPRDLVEDCIVARAPLDRVDVRDAWQVLGERGWGEGAAARVFGSGPHRSSVLRDPRGGGYLHVFAAGFGTQLEVQHAPAPEGPWSAPSILASCELPPDDPGAYCAGPVVHRELLDPHDPTTLVVGYSVGTTSPDGAARRAADPAAYWPHIVRAHLR